MMQMRNDEKKGTEKTDTDGSTRVGGGKIEPNERGRDGREAKDPLLENGRA